MVNDYSRAELIVIEDLDRFVTSQGHSKAESRRLWSLLLKRFDDLEIVELPRSEYNWRSSGRAIVRASLLAKTDFWGGIRYEVEGIGPSRRRLLIGFQDWLRES